MFGIWLPAPPCMGRRLRRQDRILKLKHLGLYWMIERNGLLEAVVLVYGVLEGHCFVICIFLYNL